MVLAASLGPTAPASADPGTVPVFVDPAPPGPVTVSGDVNITVASSPPAADSVQFFLDGAEYGPLVALSGTTATADWPTWSRPDGDHTWTAADCDAVSCNPTQAAPLTLTIANTPPTLNTSPVGPTVDGDVTVTATTAAPLVQFYLDSVAFGAPIAGNGTSASVQWPTWSRPDGDHTWTAANCDVNGCNATKSAPLVRTINNTPPAFSTPTDGASVSGVVTVTATTAAPEVQFELDDVAFGAPVTVSAGSASVQWPTFGIVNGSYDWTAAACDDNGCSTEVSTISVTLANAAPTITSPASGDVTPADVTINATSTGGGLAFFVDGAQVGFDATAPYSFTASAPLAMGGHTASVKQCDTTGTACNGPSSSTVNFTVGKLTPSITSVGPSPFSPGINGTDGRATFRVNLPEPQSVKWRVRNGSGQTIRGPRAPGLEPAGTHTYSWDGRDNAGKFVTDGVYTIVVETSTGSGVTLLQGADSATIRVDRTGTTFGAVTGKRSTVYPVRDGYLDVFRPTVRVNEGGRIRLVITNAGGTRLRVISQVHSSEGTLQFRWDGLNAKKQLVRKGKYGFRFLAEDRAGNRSASSRYSVRVSHRRTVRKTVTVVRPGDVGQVGSTNARCTQYSYGFSNFRHGLWLDNFCDRGFGEAVIYADYTLAVPGAVQYDDLRVRVVGATYSPGPISVQVFNFGERKWDAAGKTTPRVKSKVVASTFRKVSGAQRVSLRHRVRIRVIVPNLRRQVDYDVARAGIVLTYRRLR
jgi:flagellar hook assembly protein FlgD